MVASKNRDTLDLGVGTKCSHVAGPVKWGGAESEERGKWY